MLTACLMKPAEMEVGGKTNHLTVDVSHNRRLSVTRPRTPTSPNPLDNEILTRRQSTGLSAFNDYVDLVKRHLMYAVREEVEILKQQIGEMMDRIGQLEYENTVLRSEAKPETLNKLLQPRLAQPQAALPAQPQTASITAAPTQQQPAATQVQPPQQQQQTSASQVGQPPSTT